MPTRIVLRETDAPPAASPRERNALFGSQQEWDVENPPKWPGFETPDRMMAPMSPSFAGAIWSQKVVSFCLSILQKVPQNDDEQNKGAVNHQCSSLSNVARLSLSTAGFIRHACCCHSVLRTTGKR
jgi:hypothetical protein